MSVGTLYGIGIGPGDPELITLKGVRLIQRVSLVFLPATAPGGSYAGTIAAEHLDASRQEVVELVCPPLRDRAALAARWSELADEVSDRLRDGREAVFLTEGDPSMYSTFQYLAAALRQNHPQIDVRSVPGITSACAAAAAAGVPLGMWDERLAIVPATGGAAEICATLQQFDTTVLLKPSRGTAALRPALQAMTGAHMTLVRRAGRPEEAIWHGDEALSEAAQDYFSLLIVRRNG